MIGIVRSKGPSDAERARTFLAAATEVRVGVLQDTDPVLRHVVDRDGSILFVPAPQSRLAIPAGTLPSTPLLTLTAFDVARVPVLDRVRGVLTVQGHVTRESTPAGVASDGVRGVVLRLHPTQVLLRWRCEVPAGEPGRHLVPLDAYARAAADPLAGAETRWLAHVHADHQAELADLARRAEPTRAESAKVLPLCLDRYGLVLRLQHADGTHDDVRLPFPTPADCACEASDAVNALFAASAPHGSTRGGCG